MNSQAKKTAHQRVVEDYFRTTSDKGSAHSDEEFDMSVLGLQRRLGAWFDVAGKDVVDLGSGTGELCKLAVQQGARRVVGVNLSQEEIDFARDRMNIDFFLQDIAEYLETLPDSSVDRIFAMNILEHLDKEQLLRVLESSFRCLRPHGQLIAMVPNATSPFGTMTRYWDITHHNAFTPSSVRQLSRIVGFGEAAKFRECGPIPYAFVSSVRYALWQVIRLIIKGYLMVELASTKGGIYTADMMFLLSKPSE
jgi:SAM-dependent methyltransferase